MNFKSQNSQRQQIWIEGGWGLLSIALLFFTLRKTLFGGSVSLGHDNYYWNYPLFHLFAESLANGVLPTWNPYSHGGEPFFPILGQMRLLEPVAILTVLIGKYLTSNITLLFNWHRILHSLICYLGIYLLFRNLARHIVTRLALITILLFSSVMLGSFRCDGILHDFLWMPYLLICLNRIVFNQEFQWSRWLLLAGFIGINFQSYFFVPCLVLLLFYFLSITIFYFKNLKDLKNCPRFKSKIAGLLFILFCMALPNIAVLLEKEDLSFPARSLPENYKNLPPSEASHAMEMAPSSQTAGIRMPYSAIEYSGTFLNLWNFLELLAPDGNKWIHGEKFKWQRWGRASEAYLYLGSLTWFIVLIGFFLGSDPHKKLWLFLFWGFSLYAIGPPAFLHRVLYYCFPPTWFLRHGAYLVLFIEMSMLYFFVLGMNFVIQKNQIFQIRAISMQTLWVLLSSFSTAYCFHQLLKIYYPYQNLLALGIALLCIFFYAVRKYLGREGLVLALFFSHVFLILNLHPHKAKMLISLTLSIALPTLFYLYWSRSRTQSLLKDVSLGILLIMSLQLDLLYRMREVDVLYRGTYSPAAALNSSPYLKAFTVPKQIGIAPIQPKFFNEDYQAIRYSELILRAPHAFSVLRDPHKDDDPFRSALLGKRWDQYILLRDYQDLVYSNHSEEIIKSILGIDRDLFSFRLNLETEFNSESIDYQILSYRPNFIRLQTRTKTYGYLHFRDGFHRHWTAKLNGLEIGIKKSNSIQKAIWLPAGKNRIEFQYRPLFFIWGSFIFLSVFGFCLLFPWLHQLQIAMNRLLISYRNSTFRSFILDGESAAG